LEMLGSSRRWSAALAVHCAPSLRDRLLRVIEQPSRQVKLEFGGCPRSPWGLSPISF